VHFACIGVSATIFLPALLAPQAGAQQKRGATQEVKTTDGDWPLYRHDLAGTGYSPLAQITTQNVDSLGKPWSYRLESDSTATAPTGRGRGGANSEASAIVVKGVMYVPAANRIVALEPETGKEIWVYPVAGGAPSRRGVAYWPGDGSNPPRILFTAGRRLIALNANTGKLDPGFVREGDS
jgi:quinoprotein glucose dehydrogenase